MNKKPDDASRIAGLASILKTSNQPREVASSVPQLTTSVEEVPAPAPHRKSKRIGKYRNPDYDQYGVYLRKDTHKRAVRRLEDTESEQDFSELVQQLVEKWLAAGKTTN